MKNSSKIAVIAVVLVALAAGTFTYLNYSNGQGTLNIYVQDAPTSNVSAVYITFSAVSVHGNQSGWTNYTTGNTTVNILNLTTTNASLLKSITLNAEKYTMIRLYITSVNITENGKNVTFTLHAPFAFINHPFTVSKNSATKLNIDFNLNQDLNMQSKVFTPNIGMVVS